MADANTIFLTVNYNDTLQIITDYTAYTGVANAPSFSATDVAKTTDFKVLDANGSLAKLVVIYDRVQAEKRAYPAFRYWNPNSIVGKSCCAPPQPLKRR